MEICILDLTLSDEIVIGPLQVKELPLRPSRSIILRIAPCLLGPLGAALRSPTRRVKRCCTCQGNYNSKWTHEQLEAPDAILYKAARYIGLATHP